MYVSVCVCVCERFWYSHLGSIEEEEEEVEGAVASNTSPDARPKLKSKVIARLTVTPHRAVH